MVTFVQPAAQLGKAAADALRRAGVAARPAPPSIFLVPYFLCESRGSWTGFAAASLPATCLESIPVYGADTTWFDAGTIPAGMTLIEPTRSAPAPDGADGSAPRTVAELRHLPIAHVAFEGAGGSGSVWIDAERGQVLGGSLPAGAAERGALRDAPAFLKALTLAAAFSAASALVLPSPWGALGSIPIALAVHGWSDPRRVSARLRGSRIEGA